MPGYEVTNFAQINACHMPFKEFIASQSKHIKTG